MEQFPYINIFSHIHKSGGTSINYHIKRNLKKDQYLHIHFGEPDCFYNASSRKYDIINNRDNLLNYLNSLSIVRLDKIRSVFGHDVFYGLHDFFQKEYRYFTFLRNPIPRFLSYYNYSRSVIERLDFKPATGNVPWLKSFFDKSELIPFVDYVQLINEKPACLSDHFLSQTDHLINVFEKEHFTGPDRLTQAKRVLQRFFFVGITELFDDFLFSYEEMGFNKIYHNYNITQKDYTDQQGREFLLQNTPDALNDELKLYEHAINLNHNFKQQNQLTYSDKVKACSEKIDEWTLGMINKELTFIRNKEHFINSIKK